MEVAIGGLFTALGIFLGAWMQRRNDEAREKRADERAELIERRAEQREIAAAAVRRARRAATRTDELATILYKQLPQQLLATRRRGVSDEEENRLTDEVNEHLEEIDSLLVDLPPELQARVERSLNVLRYCDELGCNAFGGGYHYHGDRQIAHNVTRELHVLMAAFLRQQALPELSDLDLEYAQAYAELIDDREAEYAEDIHESRMSREEWLAKRPRLRDELRDRPSVIQRGAK